MSPLSPSRQEAWDHLHTLSFNPGFILFYFYFLRFSAVCGRKLQGQAAVSGSRKHFGAVPWGGQWEPRGWLSVFGSYCPHHSLPIPSHSDSLRLWKTPAQSQLCVWSRHCMSIQYFMMESLWVCSSSVAAQLCEKGDWVFY